MNKRLNIAIDGPAGAGKSTIARQVARQLGIVYLDTGAMYRAIGYKALQTGTDVRSEEALAAMLAQTDLDIRLTGGRQQVLLDGRDVTTAIRSSPAARAASDVSAVGAVRHHLVAMQRRMAAEQDLVLDGRDIGTVVLPDAPYKFFLTADLTERARRRLADLQAAGEEAACLEAVQADMAYRDQQDSQRVLAPLRQAQDAHYLDTTGLSIEEVVGRVLAVVRPQKT